MAADAEAGAEYAAGERLAHQEFLRALSGLVVIVDHAVVGGVKAIVAARRLAGEVERGELYFAFQVAFVFGIENVEGVSRLHGALKIHVEGIDLDQRFDDIRGHVVPERRLVDRIVEAHLAVFFVIVARRLRDLHVARFRNRDVAADIRKRDRAFMRGVVEDRDAQRLDAPGRRRRHQNANAKAFLEGAVAAPIECGDQGARGLRLRAEFLQDRCKRIASLRDDSSFGPVVAAFRLDRRLLHDHHVFGDGL